MKKPPLFIFMPHYVIEYAKIDKGFRLSKKKRLNVNGKYVGEVPKIVISKNVDAEEYNLIHCNKKWGHVFAFEFFDSLKEAKKAATEHYPSVKNNWIKTNYSIKKAKKHIKNERKKIDRNKCSFCLKKMYDEGVTSIFRSEKASICNECISWMNKEMITKSDD